MRNRKIKKAHLIHIKENRSLTNSSCRFFSMTFLHTFIESPCFVTSPTKSICSVYYNGTPARHREYCYNCIFPPTILAYKLLEHLAIYFLCTYHAATFNTIITCTSSQSLQITQAQSCLILQQYL
ncbi:hypothetical protein LOAG_00539 [Loa loa]|uniref:Uncharacterized protein n=1 Tax=Loa loa TaxID=7209 RepID=A0A1S0UD35_LOALO|nr:hypothetical protein LOAG_00539 [Loa loa]EFO27946.1 hypothetical protein LOAG_00539 [Loa loa]